MQTGSSLQHCNPWSTTPCSARPLEILTGISTSGKTQLRWRTMAVTGITCTFVPRTLSHGCGLQQGFRQYSQSLARTLCLRGDKTGGSNNHKAIVCEWMLIYPHEEPHGLLFENHWGVGLARRMQRHILIRATARLPLWLSSSSWCVTLSSKRISKPETGAGEKNYNGKKITTTAAVASDSSTSATWLSSSLVFLLWPGFQLKGINSCQGFAGLGTAYSHSAFGLSMTPVD